MQYDLEARTALFSKNLLAVIKIVAITEINRNIISQLVRSATSVGANYREANGASSRRDFKNKIFICRKEIQETKYWLELLAATSSQIIQELRKLWKEAHELNLIFNKISSTLNRESKNRN